MAPRTRARRPAAKPQPQHDHAEVADPLAEIHADLHMLLELACPRCAPAVVARLHPRPPSLLDRLLGRARVHAQPEAPTPPTG